MKTLLVLEEDQEGRKALAKVLKKQGYGVLQARDTSAALEHIDSRQVDLVLAGATNHDRSEFLADLRGERPLLPVVFLTDYCEPESRLRGFRYGPFCMSRRLHFYINMRPIGLHELTFLIRMVLGRRIRGRREDLVAA